MKIYWFKAQAPRRVLATVKHLGLPAEFEKIEVMKGGLRTEDYVALNPNKKAPTLTDGDLVLWEATAIMAHLAIKAGSDMWPAANPAEQVEMLRWLSWNNCHWAPAVGTPYLEHIIKPELGIGEPDDAAVEASLGNIHKFAKVLNPHLEGREFVVLDRLTIADFSLASMACYWRKAAMPFENYPNIVRWLDRLDELPAWQNPWPDAG